MKNIVITLLLIGLISCNKERIGSDPKGPINEKSYIQGFFELNDLIASPVSGFNVDKVTHSIKNNTSFDPEILYKISDRVGISAGTGNERLGNGFIVYGSILYDTLVARIGDVSYNSKITDGFAYEGIVVALVDTLQTVTITCDKIFDEQHPVGSNLNDLFSVYFEDPYATIKNGYKSSIGDNYYTIDAFLNPNFPYSLFGAPLTSVDFTKKYHIGTEWYFILEKAPEKTDEYLFTVSITNTSGKTIEKDAIFPIKLKGLND